MCAHMSKSRLSTAEKWIKFNEKTKEIMNLMWKERQAERDRKRHTKQASKQATKQTTDI